MVLPPKLKAFSGFFLEKGLKLSCVMGKSNIK
jgi:hypothetical protein